MDTGCSLSAPSFGEAAAACIKVPCILRGGTGTSGRSKSGCG